MRKFNQIVSVFGVLIRKMRYTLLGSTEKHELSYYIYIVIPGYYLASVFSFSFSLSESQGSGSAVCVRSIIA